MFFRVVFVLYESITSKFSLILFAYNLMIGYLKKNREIIRENTLYKKKKETRVSANQRSNNWALKFKFALSWRPPYTQLCARNKVSASFAPQWYPRQVGFLAGSSACGSSVHAYYFPCLTVTNYCVTLFFRSRMLTVWLGTHTMK